MEMKDKETQHRNVQEKEEQVTRPEFAEGSHGPEEPEGKKKRDKAEPQVQTGDLDYCRFAADPEHERGYREEEPCDDARTGDYEKTNRK
jgi:hypothetical protein